MVLLGELAPPSLEKRVFALGRLAINLGMTIGPALGGVLAARWFPALFVVDGVTALAAAAIMHWLVDAPAGGAGTQGTPAEGARLTRSVLADRPFVVFLAGMVAVGLIFFQLDAAMPLYITRELGISTVGFGLLFAVNSVLIIAAEVPLTAAIEHWSTHRTLALGAALVTVGFAGLALARDWWTAALTVVVWTFGEMILFPTSSAHVYEAAPEGRAGQYMGLYTMAFASCFAVGPWAGAAVMERFGSASLWGLAVPAVGALSVGLLWRCRPPHPSVQV
jgi:MFS family permease